MAKVARVGDTATIEDESLKDTMDNETPPPPDSRELDEDTGEFYDCYSSPPSIEVTEIIKAKGESTVKIFANGRPVLTADSKFSDIKINYYDRKFELDDKKQIKYANGKPEYSDSLKRTETIDGIECKEGSPSVFANGSPIARKGDKLSKGKIDSGSSNVFVP